MKVTSSVWVSTGILSSLTKQVDHSLRCSGGCEPIMGKQVGLELELLELHAEPMSQDLIEERFASLEAIARRLEAIASRLEAIAI